MGPAIQKDSKKNKVNSFSRIFKIYMFITLPIDVKDGKKDTDDEKEKRNVNRLFRNY